MSQKYEKLKALLKELFQLDQPDLDFGFYRIMHAKSAEVSQFLDKDLLPQVQAAFGQYKTADKAEIEKDLAKVIAGIEAAGMDPAQSPRVSELRARFKSDAVDMAALESEVYDNLYSFFRRYYSEGDFLAKRVYKPGVYAIPYEGEEVALHWANKDQYYIKTSEYLRDYAFRLRPDNDKKPMRVHFRLVDAAEGEHGNVKAAEGKDRVFVLAAPGESGLDPSASSSQGFLALESPAPRTGEGRGEGEELVIRFEYRPATLSDWPEDVRSGKTKPPAQKDLITIAVKRILSLIPSRLAGAGQGEGERLAAWIAELGKPHITTSGERADYTRLEAHIKRYTARNTFDYFIHKDLNGFLRRELDFYIKNEVMHLDDVENETAPRVEQYLSKIKIIRKIAGKIIDFLAQLEDFQKKLWLKKKFVVETQYCITVGCIPEVLYPEIATNEAQHEEWVKLYAIDEIKGDMVTPGHSKPLKPEFLKANPTLVVDTRHFNVGFMARLLEAMGDIDEQTDGVLFHSENFQALSLMQARYREKVKCVYIDPPYNTGEDSFVYKDAYPSSTWLAMMSHRVDAARDFLTDDGSLWCSLDDNELGSLLPLMADGFGADNFVANIVWQKRTSPDARAALGAAHDYIVVYAKNLWSFKATKRFVPLSDERRSNYANPDNELRGPWASVDLTGQTGHATASQFYEVATPTGRRYSPPPGRCWALAEETFKKLQSDDRIWFGSDGSSRPRLKRFLSESEGSTAWTWWPNSEVGHNQEATKELNDIIGGAGAFETPKPTRLIARVQSLGAPGVDAHILDYFAGSGTTGHATINLNREDGGRRKFILVEMGDYFDTVLLPRIKKVTFTPEWKEGKPKHLATPEEAERSPRIVKVVRLESYEDTLNNLETRRTDTQQLLLDAAEAQGADGLREQYILRYMLNVETRGSQSLLNVQAFTEPTAYKLKIKRSGSDESREVNIDLLETFNWLIGLTVRHIAAPQSFTAAFERDSEKRLRLKGRLKQVDLLPHPNPLPQGDNEPKMWWFRTVSGATPDGRKTLIIWRTLTGDPEQDNLVLDEWFTKQGYSARDSEFDIIYVNGGNNLENLKTPDDLWKVRLIEEDFHRLMFETEGA